MFLKQFEVDSSSTLVSLYEKAKRAAWNASSIDWDLPNEFEPELAEISPGLARALQATEVSQYYYGEQAAIAVCGQLLIMAPNAEAKLYLASQISDEGRHFEVFGRFLAKLGGPRPMYPATEELLTDFAQVETLEEKILGMQVIFETAALHSFRAAHRTTRSDLWREILTYVIADETRHTAFGQLYLEKYFPVKSKALRKRLEARVGVWWKLFAETQRYTNPAVDRFLPAKVLERQGEVLARAEVDLALVGKALRKRLRRLGLELLT